MKELVIERFWSICQLMRNSYEDNVDEERLVELLTLVKGNLEYRVDFTHCFLEIMGPMGNYPYEIVEFCMRDLQWPEIRMEAERQLKQSSDFRVKNVMVSIIQAYDENWENTDLYQYYSKTS